MTSKSEGIGYVLEKGKESMKWLEEISPFQAMEPSGKQNSIAMG